MNIKSANNANQVSPSAANESYAQYLTFSVNRETYGIDILNIREIIDHQEVARVPMMSDTVEGVINLRGSIVPVINLARRFRRKASEGTKKTSIIIVDVRNEGEHVDVGITVDEVSNVLDVALTNIENAPSFGTKIRPDFIQGMAKNEGDLLILLNVDTILSIDELCLLNDKTR
ncbi:MAG: chemotaxis protein CheW [Alteromonadaceae bacterium]|nr:MAG: chemotaxis protein CheW [Alteromonadaceae bacterium]